MLSGLIQQPIARAELTHQFRSIQQRRGWAAWINRAITIAVYTLAGIMVASEIIALFRLPNSASFGPFSVTMSEWLRALTVLPFIVALTTHFRRMFQTLSLSANSIAREKAGVNWDMLVLTGVDAGKIVRGKWWATVRHQWRPYVALGILRAMLVVWYSANSNRYYSSFSSATDAAPLLLTLLQFLLAGAAVFILTLANLLFTAACGVSAFNKRSGVALVRAIGTRLLIIITIGLLAGLFYHLWYLSTFSYNYTNYNYNPTTLIVPMTGIFSVVTLFDNGVVLGTQIASYNWSNNSFLHSTNLNALAVSYLPAVIVALLTYALLTFLLLRFAQWQAVRESALPPAARRKLVAIK